jgi:hypothetical protein
VEFTREKNEGDQEVVRLTKLQPGFHLLILSRISKEGRLEEQSQLQIQILPKPSWWSLVRIPLGALVILLLVAALLNRSR